MTADLARGSLAPPAWQEPECHLCPGVCVLPGCPHALHRDKLAEIEEEMGAAHEPEAP